MSIAVATRTPVITRTLGRFSGLAAACAMALTLAACGGGDQVNKFKPNKIVSFGDENSVITTQTVGSDTLKGQKFGVNYVVTDKLYYISNVVQADPSPTLIAEDYSLSVTHSADSDGLRAVTTGTSVADSTHTRNSYTLWTCSLEARLWMQIMANSYGLGFETNCPADKAGAVTYAAVGAKVADTIAQINAHRGEITDKTMVTVWAGQNDILEQWALYKTTPNPSALASIKATLKARGEQLGQAVNSLISTGGRVLIVTVPDLGKAPGAASYTDTLTELTDAFNQGFIGINGIKNDGTKIGLVKAYELIQDIAKNPGNYSINATQAACNKSAMTTPEGVSSPSLLNCTNLTLVPGASTYSHLWADDFVLAPGGQARIGALAFNRANDNPF